MSSDGMCFYDAWLVLRKDHGAKLCGLDLGNGRQPADRRNYQAGKFSEFCAEVFMQAATGEVAAHVRTLAADADTPAAVLDAWKDVVRVLLKYRPIILGG